MFKTISHRIFITFGTLTAIVCVLFAVITWLFAAVTEDDVVKQVMHTEARFIQTQYQRTKQTPTPRVDYIALYLNESEMSPAIATAINENKYEKEFSFDGRNMHFEKYALTPETAFWLTIDATPIQAIRHVTGVMSWFLLGVTTLVMLAALYFAWKLSLKTALPLVRLTETVSRHRPGDDFKSDDILRTDEIGELSRSFQTAFNDISELLKREKNFTNDVSHELRTPITLLMNTLALSDKSSIANDEKVLLSQVAKDLKNTVEVLLALARSENLVFESLAIVPAIERSILTLHQSNPEYGFKAKLEVQIELKVHGNFYLISLLLQNLINNAFYHGGDGELVIFNRGNVLIFENKLGQKRGPSYDGLGHGQYLVQRIAHTMHWHVNVYQEAGLFRVEVHTSSSG